VEEGKFVSAAIIRRERFSIGLNFGLWPIQPGRIERAIIRNDARINSVACPSRCPVSDPPTPAAIIIPSTLSQIHASPILDQSLSFFSQNELC